MLSLRGALLRAPAKWNRVELRGGIVGRVGANPSSPLPLPLPPLVATERLRLALLPCTTIVAEGLVVDEAPRTAGEYVLVVFIGRAYQAGGRGRRAGGHRPSAGGQLGGGGTGCPQPPGQPDARQRVGRQGACRYKRGAGRRRAGRTSTGTFAFLPAAPIPSIPGRAARLSCRLVLSISCLARRVRSAWCTFSSLGRCLPPLSLLVFLHRSVGVNFPRGKSALANDSL